MKNTVRWLVLAWIVLIGEGCVLAPPFYIAKPISGRVLDAETGAPVQDAIVVAQWKLYSGGMGHGGHDGSLHDDEVVTDADGRFTLPGWGPKLRPFGGVLDQNAFICVFHTGYMLETRFDDEEMNNSLVRRSQWDGTEIRLPRDTSDPRRRVSDLEMLLHCGAGRNALEAILREKTLRKDLDRDNIVFSLTTNRLKELKR